MRSLLAAWGLDTSGEEDCDRRNESDAPKDYLGILGSLGLAGWSATIPTSEMGEIRPIDVSKFTGLAPRQTLSELVQALDRGKQASIAKFSAKYRAMHREFDVGKMKDHPMLVAERTNGPLVEFDGLPRMCCLRTHASTGANLPESLPVLLGVGSGVRCWQPFFGPSRVGRPSKQKRKQLSTR